MIRFIDLRRQIHGDESPHFAFYNTVTDKFVVFGHDQSWDSIKDFKESGLASDETKEMIERCERLIPMNYFLEASKRVKAIKLEEPVGCQEASTLSRGIYIPCGRPSKALVENKDSHLYFMCEMCTSHNVKNRGAHLVATVEMGRYGQ